MMHMRESLSRRLRSAAFQRLALAVSLGFCLLGVGAHPVWFSAAFLFQALALIPRPRTQIFGWLLAALSVSWFLFLGDHRSDEGMVPPAQAIAVPDAR
jgi:hypothetical protein